MKGAEKTRPWVAVIPGFIMAGMAILTLYLLYYCSSFEVCLRVINKRGIQVYCKVNIFVEVLYLS